MNLRFGLDLTDLTSKEELSDQMEVARKAFTSRLKRLPI